MRTASAFGSIPDTSMLVFLASRSYLLDVQTINFYVRFHFCNIARLSRYNLSALSNLFILARLALDNRCDSNRTERNF